MILVELTGAIDAAGTLRTWYLSTGRFVTSPTDSPAHTAFLDRIREPGRIGISIFSDGKTTGGTKLETGEIILNNADGYFDDFINYGFDGRRIVIRSGESGAYPFAFATVVTATVEAVDVIKAEVIIRIRDLQFLFSRQAQTNVYLGNNSLPNGLEGTADDLKGKPKPLVFGSVFNITPPCVNTSKLTYQVNDGPVFDIPDVYSDGVAWTQGADHATSAALQAASITPGTSSYQTCLAEGYFRLSDAPAGELTCDVIQGATAADRTVAQILWQLAQRAGI